MKKGREPRTHRLTVRLPLRLHQALVPLATEEKRYVSDWIVVTLERAIANYDPTTRYPVDLVQEREFREKRLILRVSPSLHAALIEMANAAEQSISRWVSTTLERAIAERSAMKKPPERKP